MPKKKLVAIKPKIVRWELKIRTLEEINTILNSGKPAPYLHSWEIVNEHTCCEDIPVLAAIGYYE